jgi:hypothetical protein
VATLPEIFQRSALRRGAAQFGLSSGVTGLVLNGDGPFEWTGPNVNVEWDYGQSDDTRLIEPMTTGLRLLKPGLYLANGQMLAMRDSSDLPNLAAYTLGIHTSVGDPPNPAISAVPVWNASAVDGGGFPMTTAALVRVEEENTPTDLTLIIRQWKADGTGLTGANSSWAQYSATYLGHHPPNEYTRELTHF